MGKAKQRIVPRPPGIQGEDSGAERPEPATDHQAATADAPPKLSTHSAILELPLAAVSPGSFMGRNVHIELRLKPPESELLKSLQTGLDAAGVRLRDGRRVASKADTVRWLLEQLAAQAAD